MREKLPQRVERGRVLHHSILGSCPTEGMSGMFDVMGPAGKRLHIMSSIEDDSSWEHVSVSTPKRAPTWEEMCFVKDAFWLPEEAVFQLHPPRSEWVNNHPNCLHMWRNVEHEVPLPPGIFVGIKHDGTYKNAAEAYEGYVRMKARGEIE